MTDLELDGYLQAGTPFYSDYQFKPQMTSAEILARFEGERRDFLKRVLAKSVKKKTWFNIDVDTAARSLGEPRERIVNVLDYLGEQQMLELKVAGVRSVFRRLKTPDSLPDLTQKLVTQVQQREDREVERLQDILKLIALDSCQVAHLCDHFGQPIDSSCGHCGWCESQSAAQLTDRHGAQLNEVELKFVSTAIVDLQNKLPQPAQVARLLCGLSSPAISKERPVSYTHLTLPTKA